MTSALDSPLDTNSLSSAHLRYTVRHHVASSAPGPERTRPFGLRVTTPMPTPANKDYVFCHTRQVAVDADGRPLIETMGKDWKTKSTTDGDEGPEENWGWEEG
jgi:putative ATP-grasp target RiPP